MRQILHKTLRLRAWMMMAMLIAAVTGAWADVSTLTFTAACGGSGTADNGVTWTVTSDGTESSYEDDRGIHYGTGKAAVKYIELSTSGISGTITKVVVNASTASGVTATAGVTVGGAAFGGDAQSLSSTAKDYTFTGSASGEIIVTVTKSSSAVKAIYVKSVEVTYTTSGGETPTPTEKKACDLALTGAPIALTFDMYDNHQAQYISYTSSSTGEITAESNAAVSCNADPQTKTICVTPYASTNGEPLVITLNQAADDNYEAGSVTFTVKVTDSTPSDEPDPQPQNQVVIWSEDFSSFKANDVPTEGVNAKYTCEDGGTKTKIYAENTAGGTSPELLVSKSNGKSDGVFSVVITDLKGCAGETTLSFITNRTDLSVTIKPDNSWGVTKKGDIKSKELSTLTFDLPAGTQKLTIEFSMTISSNARLDNIVLTGKSSDGRIASGLAFSAQSATALLGSDENTFPTLTNPNNLDVSFASSNEQVATINENGAISLIAAGETTIEASFQGNDEYSAGSASYTLTVVDPNVPGSENNPYTVAQARAAIDAGTGITSVYAKGIVSEIVTAYNSQYGNISYNISADGTTDGDQLQAYRGKSYNGANFTSADDIQVGDEVVIFGDLKKYSSTYEFDQNNQLVSLNRSEKQDAGLSFGETTEFTITLGDDFTAPTLINPNNIQDIVYMSSNVEVASVDPSTGAVNVSGVGETTITVSFRGNDTYKAGSARYTLTVESNKLASDLSIDPQTTNTLTVGDIVELKYSTSSDGAMTWSSSNTEVLTVEDGTITAVGVGTATITLTQEASNNYDGGVATIEFTVKKASTIYEGNAFVKVSDANSLEDGAYLIVYEEKGLAFDGGLETLDGTGNTIEVKISENKIVADEYNKAAMFTIESAGDNGYTVLAANGKYIGQSSDANGLSAQDDAIYNTISFDENGINIIASGGAYLRYNSASNQTRFRYYKSSSYTNQEPIALYKLTTVEVSTEPDIEVGTNAISATAEGAEGSFAVTVNNITEVQADVIFCDADGTTATYDWVEARFDTDGNVYYLISANTGEARTAYMKVYAHDDNGNDVYSELITITQEAYEAPVTYTLAAAVTSGKHYIIVGDGKAMGQQRTNNREAVKINIGEEGTASVEGNDVYEFVVYGPDANGYYTIYDGSNDGFLYASSSSSNNLKNQASVDANGLWAIEFDSESGAASITAQGNNTRNVMQYNSSSSIFSCYDSASQADVYLYERDDDTAMAASYARTTTTGNFGTLCLPNNATVLGAKLYSIEGKNSESDPTCIKLSEVKGTAQAGVPYIFEATATSLQAYYSQKSTATASDNNGLVGSFTRTDVAEGMYLLSGGKVVKCGTGCNIAANRAYIDMSQVPVVDTSAAGVKLGIGDITVGIDGIQREGTTGSIYNIAGQRMSKLQRGLNIVDGKKILVK